MKNLPSKETHLSFLESIEKTNGTLRRLVFLSTIPFMNLCEQHHEMKEMFQELT